MLIVSFIIMGLEMTATRFIAPSFGNTVYTWGIVISVFLIASSAGYIIGGYIADKKSSNDIMLFFYLFGILTTALIPLIKDSVFPYLDSFSSTWGTAVGVIILYFIPNLLFSSIVTVLMKFGLDDGVSGKLIGNLHSASAIGSVLGTLVTTFWFIPLTNIDSVIGIFVGMILLAYLFYFSNKAPAYKILVFIPVTFVFLPYISIKEPSSDILYQTTSLYHDIYVYESDYFDGQEGQYRYLTFGNKTTIQGVMDMKQPDSMILDYAKSVSKVSKTFVPESERVFIIGHGIGSLTRQFEKEKKEVKVAEIDKDVLEISKRYFQYEGNSVEIGDGRKILKEQTENYDVIVLDAYYNTYQIPFHLISKEFFALTNEKLQQDGILIINAIGTPKDDIVIESMNTTLKSVYPYVYIFAEDEDNELQNLIIVGSKERIKSKKIKGQRIVKVKEGKLILDGDTKLNNLN